MTPTQWLDEIWQSELPSNAKLLSAYFRKFLHNNKKTCYPSKSRMIKETGLTKKTIVKHIDILVSSGWLHLDKSKGGRCNRYTITLPAGIGLKSTLNGVKKDPVDGVKTYPLKTNTKPIKKQLYRKNKNYNSMDNLLDKSWADHLKV